MLPLAGYRVLERVRHRTDAVLAEIHVPPAEIAALRAAGVVT